MTAPVRVLFLPPSAPPDMVRAVSPAGVELVRLAEHTVEALRAALPGVDVVIGDWTARLVLREAEAAAGTRLRLVQQPGTGVETIDLDAFSRRGVPVANAGSANAQSVVEWCLGATMQLLRRYDWADGEARAGRWPQVSILDTARPRELAGSGVGIVGAGEIGRRLARMYTGLGCTVAYWSPRSRIDGAVLADLPDLFARSRIVVVAIARGAATLGLVGPDLLDRMGPGSMLIDVSRGGIVDQEAVVARVGGGALAAAALDVFRQEPPALSPEWLATENLLLSPHVAGVTAEAMARTYAVLAANVVAARDGGPFQHVVNSPVASGGACPDRAALPR